MASTDRKRILIVCQLDRYANGLKPLAIKRFLEERGHEVFLLDTYSLGRSSRDPRSLRNKLPPLAARRLGLYAVELASAVFTRRWKFGRRRLSYHALVADYWLRRGILKSSLPLDEFGLVICETPHDAGLLTVTTSARTLYDCPTPWADELYFEGRLTDRQHRRLRRLEKDLFERVDFLAFHWESYARYAVDHYGISGRNLSR